MNLRHRRDAVSTVCEVAPTPPRRFRDTVSMIRDTAKCDRLFPNPN